MSLLASYQQQHASALHAAVQQQAGNPASSAAVAPPPTAAALASLVRNNNNPYSANTAYSTMTSAQPKQPRAKVVAKHTTTAGMRSAVSTSTAAAAAPSSAAAYLSPSSAYSSSQSTYSPPAAASLPSSVSYQNGAPSAATASTAEPSADYIRQMISAAPTARAVAPTTNIAATTARTTASSSANGHTAAALPSFSSSAPSSNLSSSTSTTASSPSSFSSSSSASSSHSVSAGLEPHLVKSSTNSNVSLVRDLPPSLTDTPICPECSSEVIVDPHQGIEVCTSCGLVIGQYISDEQEWRSFSDRRGDDPNRIGGPEVGLLADAGLSTLMGADPLGGMSSSLAKLQNRNALPAKHRQLVAAFRTAGRIAAQLNLPQSITDRANDLYKRIVMSNAVRTRGTDPLIAACIFMVCKAEKVPRTLKEMCSVSDVSTRELGRAFNEIKRAGFHKVLRGQQDGSASTAAMSGAASEDEEEDVCESLIQRWGSGLKLPAPLITAAKRIAVVAKEVLKDNRDPSTTCGAALFIASQLGTMQNRRSYEAIQMFCGISPSTLRTAVKAMLRHDNDMLRMCYGLERERLVLEEAARAAENTLKSGQPIAVDLIQCKATIAAKTNEIERIQATCILPAEYRRAQVQLTDENVVNTSAATAAAPMATSSAAAAAAAPLPLSHATPSSTYRY